jgi:curved DNA-binding protein
MGKETSADYYEILQVSPRADQEIIERVFRQLAKRYHPDNKHTGDDSKFRILAEAYSVLSDQEKRAAYDDIHKASDAYENTTPFNASETRDSEAEKRIHQVILVIFYIARKQNVMKPGVGLIELEKLVGLPEKELEFHIWYLKEKGWIQRLETGEFAITADGVDKIMESNLKLRNDRLLSSAKFS